MTFAVVGGWGSDLGGRSPGLSAFRARGPVTAEPTDVRPMTSPSFVIAHPRRPWVFAATEEDLSRVLSFALTADGRLRLLSDVVGGGAGACHLALSPDGRQLVVAHYGSGSVSSFAVTPDGELGDARDTWVSSGSGPDPARQRSPHAHQALWVGNELLVCDLGSDRVHRLRLDDRGRFAAAGPPVVVPPASGPRHAAAVGDRLMVALELSAEVWVGRRTADGWTETQRLPASTHDAANVPSGIATDGDRVLVANRGPDTVSQFVLADGRLVRRAEWPSGGRTPRDLLLDGGHLWVSHQDSDEVTVAPISDPSRPALRIPVATPTAVALLPSQ